MAFTVERQSVRLRKATRAQHDITISVTEDYMSTDNSIAERFNGILKSEGVYPRNNKTEWSCGICLLILYDILPNYYLPRHSS